MVSTRRIRRGTDPYMVTTNRKYGGALPADAGGKLKDNILKLNDSIRDVEDINYH